jgi:hypothetical protein
MFLSQKKAACIWTLMNFHSIKNYSKGETSVTVKCRLRDINQEQETSNLGPCGAVTIECRPFSRSYGWRRRETKYTRESNFAFHITAVKYGGDYVKRLIRTKARMRH